MLELWSYIVISIATVHYQHKHGELGQSRETFLIALTYTLYIGLIVENRILEAISLYLSVFVWCFFIVTIFNRRYEQLKD